MEPHAVVDYNLTLSLLQSRLQHIYHGQNYARVDSNLMPESTLILCQSQLYPSVRDLGFGLRITLKDVVLFLDSYTSMLYYTVKKVNNIPVPIRDVANLFLQCKCYCRAAFMSQQNK
jgi:hypothetical protein